MMFHTKPVHFPHFPTLSTCLLAVLLLIMCGHLSVAASDVILPSDGLIASPEAGWPQWRGLRRDGISEETGLLQEWPEGGPRLSWQFDGLGIGWSSPIIVNDRIIITGDVDDELVIWALNDAGEMQWRVVNGASWEHSYPGSRASCVYSEGRLYHLNAHGRLVCLDPDTGAEIWATNILERFKAENITWGISECLLVDGPRIIVTPGGEKALMAALDKRTGETLWTTPPIEGEKASYASPILFAHGGRRIIANCSSRHGFGVDADTGELLWTVPMTNRYLVNSATPIYGAGSVFYVTSYAEDGRLYRLRREEAGISAQHAWTAPIDTVTGSGVLVDGVLHAAGYQKDKRWFAIEWESGNTLHQFDGLTTGAAVYVDERLYVLDEKGNAALVRLATDGFDVVGRFSLPATRVRNDAWAHPVVLNGRLYLRYHDTLWCYDVSR